MALFTCPDCEREVSDQAPVCPECGRPHPTATINSTPSGAREKKSIFAKPFSFLGVVAIAVGVFLFAKIRQSTSALESSVSGLSSSAEKSEDQRLREAAIAEKRVVAGMTPDEVRSSWGEPEHVNTTTYGQHVHEQWVFAGSRYVYFEDGVVTAFQQSH